MKVAPHSVSGRVVKTGIGVPASVWKRTSAPSLRPIQLRLHDLDTLRPFDAAEIQQLIGILGDAEQPLVEVLLDDRRATAVAVPILTLDLFACQGRVVLGTPVHRRELLVGQTVLVELQEEPLVPAVVFRIATDRLAGSSRSS